MTILPLGATVVIAIAMFASIWRAFLGRPAEVPHPSLAVRLLCAGIAAQFAAIAVAVLGALGFAALLAAAGVEATCAARWLGWEDRPPPDDEDEFDDGLPPVDWDVFDRERRSWDRPRVPA